MPSDPIKRAGQLARLILQSFVLGKRFILLLDESMRFESECRAWKAAG